MRAPEESFQRFLNVLSEALDEPEANGEVIAARAHRSRWHLGRIVSAVAGEPPARLRRRVLMERAAFRLATSTAGVLEVALEAGYSSNEAFTRAFRRAYGANPSAWREAPGQPLLPAPNGVHFLPPAGLRLPARREVTEMELLKRMVEHNVWITRRLIEGARRMSEAQLDEAIVLSVEGIDDQPTTRKLLSRLVGQMDMWNAAMAMREYDWSVEEHEELAAMARRLDAVAPMFLAQVNAVIDEGRLDETFVDALCEPPEVFTYGGMIAHVLNFSAHRRTLVAGALHSAGITDVGNGDPMRFVAEDRGTAGAAS